MQKNTKKYYISFSENLLQITIFFQRRYTKEKYKKRIQEYFETLSHFLSLSLTLLISFAKKSIN